MSNLCSSVKLPSPTAKMVLVSPTSIRLTAALKSIQPISSGQSAFFAAKNSPAAISTVISSSSPGISSIQHLFLTVLSALLTDAFNKPSSLFFNSYPKTSNLSFVKPYTPSPPLNNLPRAGVSPVSALGNNSRNGNGLMRNSFNAVIDNAPIPAVFQILIGSRAC